MAEGGGAMGEGGADRVPGRAPRLPQPLDALFELADAALCAPAPVGSVPALRLEPVFRRGHGSLYKSLARGRIDAEALRRALVAHRPATWPAVFAVDASTWPRCDAETSPERGFYYSASRHSAGQRIVAGWSYQWIAQLDWAPDSWTATLDEREEAEHGLAFVHDRRAGRAADDVAEDAGGHEPSFVRPPPGRKGLGCNRYWHRQAYTPSCHAADSARRCWYASRSAS